MNYTYNSKTHEIEYQRIPLFTRTTTDMKTRSIYLLAKL